MRHLLCLTLTLTLATVASAAEIGEPSPLTDGDVDGWSGTTIMNGYGGIPAGERVDAVSYYATPGRADGNHHVTALIAEEAGGAFTIWAVGPTHTAVAGGEHTFDWDSDPIPSNGNTYHPALWQWNEGVDNDAGGVVAFGSGGSGMFQQDQDGTTYVPMVGDDLLTGSQHSSGAGGRSYQFNLKTIPEPSTFALAGLAALVVGFIVRRGRK